MDMNGVGIEQQKQMRVKQSLKIGNKYTEPW